MASDNDSGNCNICPDLRSVFRAHHQLRNYVEVITNTVFFKVSGKMLKINRKFASRNLLKLIAKNKSAAASRPPKAGCIYLKTSFFAGILHATCCTSHLVHVYGI